MIKKRFSDRDRFFSQNKEKQTNVTVCCQTLVTDRQTDRFVSIKEMRRAGATVK